VSEVGPLSGIRVLDLTRMLSGPYATLLLADLGATVWKVEEPGSGDETRRTAPMRDGHSGYFFGLNRNKSSIAIDLKEPKGRDLALELAFRADVVIENFRPGVADRLGVGHEAVRAVNPSAVYCSISGFGQTGPDRGRAAFDVAIQAMGGIMQLTGEPEGRPVRAGVPIADQVAGMMADIGILAALVERASTGVGRYLDMAMQDGVVSLLSYMANGFFLTGNPPPRVGSMHASIVPYGPYPAADGEIVIATFSAGYWPKLVKVLELPELAEDPRFATAADRLARRDEVGALLSERLKTQTVGYWDQLFAENGIPAAPIRSVPEVVADPHVIGRGMVPEFDHPDLGPIRIVGSPFTFAESEKPIPVAAPRLGQHTREILENELGLGHAEIEALIESGVVESDNGGEKDG
jgi:formyl-CoA transferase/CoA:oxalate CoA-transferase